MLATGPPDAGIRPATAISRAPGAPCKKLCPRLFQLDHVLATAFSGRRAAKAVQRGYAAEEDGRTEEENRVTKDGRQPEHEEHGLA